MPFISEEAQHRDDLAAVFSAALAAADPRQAVLNAVSVDNNRLQVAGTVYNLAGFERIVVVGAGKAAARMAQAVETLAGERISAGLIIVKQGHKAPLSVIEQVEAAHPVPDEAGIEGTQRILQMVRESGDNTLIICLLSGGASSLLVSPAFGVTLQDKQETTRLLLNAGASIVELNAVRKHLSMIKGGQLSRAAWPAQLLTLVLSDVIGDPLDVIASGPTAPDCSTYADAQSVIEKYGLQATVPSSVRGYLKRGVAGQMPETVKAADPCLGRTRNVIVAGIGPSLLAAKKKGVQLGFDTRIISDSLQGEARDAAGFLAQLARTEMAQMKPGEQRCLLTGGETTVTVRGTGKGGRNQELALAFSLEIAGADGISLLSAGTDGSDGPNDAAGALVDGNTAAQARSKGLEPQACLDNNDSYGFFERFDTVSGAHSHFKTGPTGTNVMDIQIVLLSRRLASFAV